MRGPHWDEFWVKGRPPLEGSLVSGGFRQQRGRPSRPTIRGRSKVLVSRTPRHPRVPIIRAASLYGRRWIILIHRGKQNCRWQLRSTRPDTIRLGYVCLAASDSPRRLYQTLPTLVAGESVLESAPDPHSQGCIRSRLHEPSVQLGGSPAPEQASTALCA